MKNKFGRGDLVQYVYRNKTDRIADLEQGADPDSFGIVLRCADNKVVVRWFDDFGGDECYSSFYDQELKELKLVSRYPNAR